MMSDLKNRAAGSEKSSPQRSKGSDAINQLARTLRKCVWLLPAITATIYFGIIASDRYVAEAQFVVRTAAKPISTTGLEAMLQITGITSSNDSAYTVQSYLTSREAALMLKDALPLADIYGRQDIDFVARYPSIFYGSSFEHLYAYLAHWISANFNAITGITTLRVQAFQPQDAKAIADVLLKAAENKVNELNERILLDAVSVSSKEVRTQEEKLIAAQVALTQFRNAELLIDPSKSALLTMEVVAHLKEELVNLEKEQKALSAAAPTSPQIKAIETQTGALREQIAAEQKRISDPSGGLASKLASYERFILDVEYAKAGLAMSTKALENAKIEGHRQQLYLLRIADAVVPDHPTEPERLRTIATVLAINLITLLIGWLFWVGISEHGRGR